MLQYLSDGCPGTARASGPVQANFGRSCASPNIPKNRSYNKGACKSPIKPISRWRCAADLLDRRTHLVAADSAKRLGGAQAERCRGNLPLAGRLIGFFVERVFVGRRNSIFRPWAQTALWCRKVENALSFQWGLTDSLSATDFR